MTKQHSLAGWGLGFALVAALLGALGFTLTPHAYAEPASNDSIVILHSNDVHCSGLVTASNAIGYAGIAQAAVTARETYGEAMRSREDRSGCSPKAPT